MELQANLIAAVVVIALGAAALIRNPRANLYQTFATLCVSLGVFFLSLGFFSLDQQYFWKRIQWLSLAFLVPALIGFFKRFPEDLTKHEMPQKVHFNIYSLYCLVISFMPLSLLQKPKWPYLPRDLLLYDHLAQLGVLVTLFRSLHLLHQQRLRTKNPLRQTRLKILIIGAFTTIACVLIQKIPNVPALGSITSVLFLYFLYQALIRHRLLDLKELLGKGFVFAIEIFLFTTLFWALVFWAKPPKIQFLAFNSFLAVTVILLLFEPLHRLIGSLAKQIFFQQSFAFEQFIQRTRDQLPGQGNQEKTVQFVFDRLHISGRVSNSSLYLIEEELNVLRLKKEMGGDRGLPDVISNIPFIQFLKSRHRPIILENIKSLLDKSEFEKNEQEEFLLSILTSLNAQLSLPLITSAGQLQGVLNLMDRSTEEAYSNSEIRLLMTLAGQMANVLHSLKLYNQLIEKDRLLALGEMAAGLAHEIRNPLGAIKGAAQYLNIKKSGKTSKFLNIITEESDRLNRVVEQFLDFARSEKNTRAPVNINHILNHTLDVVRAQGIPDQVKIVLKLDKTVPNIAIDAERMKQVFINLALNSIQAMNNKGKLEISTHVPEAGQLEICFQDSGPGLPEGPQQQIFAPFFTTKEKGTGLGLAICERVIHDHAGEIDAQSKGKLGGACFRILLNYEPPDREAKEKV